MAKSIEALWEKVRDILKFLEVQTTGDDKGLSVIDGQLGVGSVANGQESVFGQGDSVPLNKAYHYNTANETGTVITSATDVTTVLESDSGSFVSMFDNNLAEEVLLIGFDDQQFYGFKNKYNSLGTLEVGKVVAEFLNSSDAWIDNTFMVTESDYPYTRAGWELASYSSEQVRLGQSILTPLNGTWTKRDLTVNGVTENKYWARFRLLSPATALPELEQVKIHTSRSEINADGTVEFFGLARGVKDLITASYANNLSDPSNENVVYFTGGIDGGAAKLVDNEFANNTRDSRALIVKIDQDVDTSTPLVISYPFYVKGSQTGDVRFDIEYVQITDGFIYGNQVSPDGATNVIYPIITPSNGERQVLRFEVPINEIDPTVGGVAVILTRDANAAEDTLGANVVLTGDNAQARRWRL